MFCSCSPTAQKETAPVPPPRPPPRTPEAVSEAARIAAALSGVPFAGAVTPSTPAKESSQSSMECYDEGAATREARRQPAPPAPRTTPHKLNDPLSFEEYGDHEDDRRGESVL